MIVYHGSYKEIAIIDLSKCEIGRDFGRGFYVTKYLDQAQFWAKRKGMVNKCEGVITTFNYFDNASEHFKLNVLRFKEYDEEWLDFIIKNRHPDAPVHDYDIIEGPVANDDIAKRIFIYLAGEVSKDDFLKELKFKHQPSHQIAFCTMASLQMLERDVKKSDIALLNIDDSIIQSLAKEKNISDEKAVDLYFSSDVYKELNIKKDDLMNKLWEDIYSLILKELAIEIPTEA